MVVVYDLLSDETFKTEDERIDEFKRRTGRSRATYFRLKEAMQTMGDKFKKPKE
jgi:hypothetical protein